MPVHDRRDQSGNRVGVADVAMVELVRQVGHRSARTGDDHSALGGEHLADPGPDTTDAPGHQDDPAVQAETDRARHCVSVPSKCLLRLR